MATSRRSYSEAEKEQFAQQRKEKVDELHKQLADNVTRLNEGEAWQKWLSMAAKFHRYSFNNVLLIAVQRPDATLVAGYRAWQSMGHQVRKAKFGSRAVALFLIAWPAGNGQITYPVRSAAHLGDQVLDLERPITLSAVGACPAPLVEQILAHFIPGQFALLIRSSADLGILHQLGVEPHQLHAGSSNRAEMAQPAHPCQRGQDAMVERGSEPAVLAPPIEKARGAVARMALTTTSPDGPPREQSIADLASTVSQFAGPHHPIGPFLDDSDPGRLTTGVDF